MTATQWGSIANVISGAMAGDVAEGVGKLTQTIFFPWILAALTVAFLLGMWKLAVWLQK